MGRPELQGTAAASQIQPNSIPHSTSSPCPLHSPLLAYLAASRCTPLEPLLQITARQAHSCALYSSSLKSRPSQQRSKRTRIFSHPSILYGADYRNNKHLQPTSPAPSSTPTFTIPPSTTAKVSSPILLPRTVSYDATSKPPRPSGPYRTMSEQKQGRRRRSSSLLYQEPPETIEHMSDQAALPNLNANWVNAKGQYFLKYRCENAKHLAAIYLAARFGESYWPV